MDIDTLSEKCAFRRLAAEGPQFCVQNAKDVSIQMIRSSLKPLFHVEALLHDPRSDIGQTCALRGVAPAWIDLSVGIGFWRGC